MKNFLIKLLSALMACMLALNLSSCGILPTANAADLMKGIVASTPAGKNTDEKFIGNTAQMYVNLFKKTLEQDKNSLISPLSVLIALTMTANGANGETLRQMSEFLGGDIPLDELNEYLYSYAKSLPNTKDAKFSSNNSIWFRDNENRLSVEADFLQKNADYFSAGIYKAPFDDSTLEEINNWVKDNTDGMIDKILEEIRDDAVMYLINAIVFDARWQEQYNSTAVMQADFFPNESEKQTIEMMYSEEKLYLEDSLATGFIKPYKDNNYSFAALLPNAGVSIEAYVEQLTGEGLLNTLKTARQTHVDAGLPKFSYDYSVVMDEALKALGMPDAFSGSLADFSKMATSSRGNIFIGEVLHKTFIQVDENGTKAGAVTKVEMRDESAMVGERVILNRPFVYMIIDNATNLPVFIGTFVNAE